MPDRVLILSDTHLGHPGHARSADALRPLWADFAQVIINGDTAELHHPQHRDAAHREFDRLRQLCERDGVGLTLLAGNHDPHITDERHLCLMGGAVFITHGDALHPALAPWSPRAGRMRARFAQALARLSAHDRQSLSGVFAATRFASHVNLDAADVIAADSTKSRVLLRSWSVLQVLWYWRQFPELAARFIEQYAPQTQIAVMGHSHRAGIWTVRGRTIINTGSFGFPGSPRAVTIDAARLSVRLIRLRGMTYEFDSQPIAAFDLDRWAGIAANSAPWAEPCANEIDLQSSGLQVND